MFGIGAVFSIWSGCFVHVPSEVVLLCCVAENGFHSCAVYEWKCEAYVGGRNTPLLYCSKPGLYECVVFLKSSNETKKKIFKIFRETHNFIASLVIYF